MMHIDEINEILLPNFSNLKITTNDQYVEINIEKIFLLDVLKTLKEEIKLQYDQLIDLTAIDYPSREKRFEVVYILLSMVKNNRIVVKTVLKEDEYIDSITTIHKSSNWYERECYDLFGIKFLNHPDLRRIMTDYNFEGHPLRKDFPLTGYTEVRYDNFEKKVVYEPVKLTQEYRNFDYMSPWEGFENKLIGDEKFDEEK
jgi:NADH-quinone oxidoreductase subunit C